MDPDRDRSEIIEHIQAISRKFLASIEGLDASQMTEETIDGWSVKDHLTHLAFWHELRLGEIVRISSGMHHAWSPSVDFEPMNQAVQRSRSVLSLAQAEWEYRSSVQRVVSAVYDAPAAALEAGKYGEVGLRTTHDLAHADFIKDWRARLGY